MRVNLVTLGNRKIIIPLPGIEPRFLDLPLLRLVTISITASRFTSLLVFGVHKCVFSSKNFVFFCIIGSAFCSVFVYIYEEIQFNSLQSIINKIRRESSRFRLNQFIFPSAL